VKDEKLGYHAETLLRSNNNLMRAVREKIDRLESSLRHLDPAGVMQRGFTLTTKNGIILYSPAALEPGDTIVTHFEQGHATSTVKETSKKA
jgi:exodeoxyribonuclease VII large subunit